MPHTLCRPFWQAERRFWQTEGVHTTAAGYAAGDADASAPRTRSNLDKEPSLPWQGHVAKVTSKLQVTVPKAIAEQFGMRPGDDIEWIPAGDAVRVQKGAPRARGPTEREIARRLELFDRATERQRERREAAASAAPTPRRRGWQRDDVYDRGSLRWDAHPGAQLPTHPARRRPEPARPSQR